MSRINSMLICSLLGLVVGAGIASAAPWSSEVIAARQSLLDSVKHLKTASQSPLAEADDSHMKKALAFIDLAVVELDGVSTSRKLSN